MMKLTILYDNTSLRNDLIPDWGFACLIEGEDRRILFDTGAKGELLLSNMKMLDVSPDSIDDVVISHAHWDHVGGLPDFLNRNDDVRLCVPPSFEISHSVAREVVSVDAPMEIANGIYLTGELSGIEQALFMKTQRGFATVVGCSHPGIRVILEAVARVGKTSALIGGFHGFDEFALLEGMDLICPTHCTQYKEEIARRYPETCKEGGVSQVFEIP